MQLTEKIKSEKTKCYIWHRMRQRVTNAIQQGINILSVKHKH